MKPGDGLFEQFSERIHEATPSVFAHEETQGVSNDIARHAREHCKSVGLPRIGHYRTALQRQTNPEGLSIPSGKIYLTEAYENFPLGEPEIEYSSRLVVMTNDKDEANGRFTNFLDRIRHEGPKHRGVFVLFGHTTPTETPHVKSVDSLTFAVVQSNSGEAFGFTFRKNPNKGKVRATEAMSNEWDEIREKVGYIDNCSIEAVPMSLETLALVRDELQRASDHFKRSAENRKPANDTGLERVQALGKEIIGKVSGRKSRTSS